ncbi:MAG: aminotransferase class V-fold PLP-dependent enzyme [Patescibacteria group bacterium]
MNIFNSLGSNYNFGFVLKALFGQNNNSHKEKLVKLLEKKYEGRAILVYKGREAIGLALEILKLPKGSFVAINGFTCFAVYRAADYEGYDVELIDIDDRDLNFSAKSLDLALKQNPKIKVVIIQNTLGYPCDIEKIAKICKDNNLVLIEDLAHSVKTVYKNGKEAGIIGDFVVLSFSQDKMIDAVSGGALIIRNKKYNNEAMKQLNNVSFKQQFLDRLYPIFTFIIRKTYPIGLGELIHFVLKSLNLLSKPMNESFYSKYILPSWYAYSVIEAFENLNNNLRHRKEIANIYNSILDKKIISRHTTNNIKLSSCLRYPIFVINRKSLISYLKNRGVYVSDIWYDSVDNNLKNTKTAADTILNLPTHINVSEIDAKNISLKINQWLKSQ